MRRCAGKGFSLVEVLTVIAVIAILIGLLVGAGKRIKTQADEKLAGSMIEILVSALEQYYNYHGDFPFDASVGFDRLAFEQVLDPDGPSGPEVASVVELSGTPVASSWSSSVLYYFLSRTAPSRQIIDTLTDSLISGADESGVVLQIEITIGSDAPFKIDLIRFIDPWGNALRYTYISGDNFPVIVSAGADGVFGWDGPDGLPMTADDVVSEDNISSK